MPITRSLNRIPLEDIEEFYNTESSSNYIDCLGEVIEDLIPEALELIPERSNYWRKFLNFFQFRK